MKMRPAEIRSPSWLMTKHGRQRSFLADRMRAVLNIAPELALEFDAILADHDALLPWIM
jgi:hypothetical protein